MKEITKTTRAVEVFITPDGKEFFQPHVAEDHWKRTTRKDKAIIVNKKLTLVNDQTVLVIYHLNSKISKEDARCVEYSRGELITAFVGREPGYYIVIEDNDIQFETTDYHVVSAESYKELLNNLPKIETDDT